jgi:hypothetical protein
VKARVPIGKAEGIVLEFKARLDQPARISREVVAMLNSGRGGEVWIGIVEESGLSVRVERVEDALREKRRLEDSFAESIEPAPFDREVAVDILATDGGDVVVVRVEARAGRRPYAALREGGGRQYLVRVGARIRPMSREEIAAEFAKAPSVQSSEPTAGSEALARLRRRRAEVEGRDLAWLQIRPFEDQGLKLRRDQIEILADPGQTGSRRHGWTYGGAIPRIEPFGGAGAEGWRLLQDELTTEVHDDGAVDFLAPLSAFVHEHEDELYPYALLEYVTSVLRLFRAVQACNPTPKRCPGVVGFALFGVGGWKLRAHSPESLEFRLARGGHRPRSYEEGDVLSFELVDVPWEDLNAPVDRVALRIVRKVYRSFGFEHRAIPVEFDQDRETLFLQD